MVIKIHDEATLLCNIKETFQTMMKAHMKLNSGNCTFGLAEGQIMGYQITIEGISPYQAKIRDFLDSKTPHNLKGVQEINERLTTLSRFIATSAEKALPLFQTLKG